MSMKNKNCFCLVTHKYNSYVKNQWKRIKSELNDTGTKCYIMYDFSQPESKRDMISLVRDLENKELLMGDLFLFDEGVVRRYLTPRGYDIRYYEGIPNLFYGNIMLAFMQFFLSYQTYDYYWFKEWDVDYTGTWRFLLDEYDSVDDDYLSRSCKAGVEYDSSWWHHDQWHLTTLKPFDNEELIVTFNPIMRLSHRALEFLDKVYSEGNSGFYEVFLGSVLKRFKYKIGGFYEYGDLDLDTFTYLSGGKSLDLRKSELIHNKLYHPVKESIYGNT